ncbi:MAG: mechanosensitive ion channel family protein [Nitriliruptorales bacterium]
MPLVTLVALAQQYGPLVREACIDPDIPDDTPSLLCEAVVDLTGQVRLARAADLLIATPGKILIVILLAWLASRFLRRSIDRLALRIQHGVPPGRLAWITGRRPRSPLPEADRDQAARRRQRAQALKGLLRGASNFTVWAVAALTVLGELGINLGPLVAGAGVAGVAIGFGAQNLVRDFLSGIFMLVEDQYGVGDIIEAGGTSGVVENVGLRVTRIRDVKGVLWHIPNGRIEKVGNKSQEWSRAVLDIEIAYDNDIAHAKRVIKEVADALWREPEWSGLITQEPEVWGVEAFNPDGIVIRLVVQTRPLEQYNVARELRARLKEAFEREGIDFGVPQRVVWLHSGEPGSDPQTQMGASPQQVGSSADGGSSSSRPPR